MFEFVGGTVAGSADDTWISRLIDAAKLEARRLGAAFSFAIVDEGGHLRYFERQPDAPLFSCHLAEDKAYTAAITGRTTADWAEMSQEELVVSCGLMNLERFMPLPGGVPIILGGQAVGALGVSGGTWRQDVAVADSALAVL